MSEKLFEILASPCSDLQKSKETDCIGELNSK